MFKFGGREVRVVAASGALGYDGRGYCWERLLIWLGLIRPRDFDLIIIKTLTRYSQKGNWRWYNPRYCFRFLKEGTVNAIGLANPGIDWWLRQVASKMNSGKIPLVVSLAGTPLELAEMANALRGKDIVGIEINVSCPNVTDNPATAEEIIACCQAVKNYAPELPILLKLSVATPEIREVLQGVAEIVKGLSVNSVPWNDIYPQRCSPLAHLGNGGVSGKIAQPYTWAFIRRLRTQMFHLGINIPIIVPSVWDEGDIRKARAMAREPAAVSFASLLLCHPLRVAKLIVYIRRTEFF